MKINYFNLIRFLRLPQIRSKYGLKFTANFSDKTFMLYVKAKYGYFYWNRLQNINEPFVFLDVGANQGLYAIGAAQNLNLLNSYAFEPVQSTFNYLEKNIKINKVEAKCVAKNIAIANRQGQHKIRVAEGHSGLATMASANNLGDGIVWTEKIEATDASGLNSIIKERNETFIVKLDVEGYELTVIEELMKTEFSSCIREIFLEVDEQWVDLETITKALRNHGFSNFTKIGKGTHYDLLVERE